MNVPVSVVAVVIGNFSSIPYWLAAGRFPILAVGDQLVQDAFPSAPEPAIRLFPLLAFAKTVMRKTQMGLLRLSFHDLERQLDPRRQRAHVSFSRRRVRRRVAAEQFIAGKRDPLEREFFARHQLQDSGSFGSMRIAFRIFCRRENDLITPAHRRVDPRIGREEFLDPLRGSPELEDLSGRSGDDRIEKNRAIRFLLSRHEVRIVGRREKRRGTGHQKDGRQSNCLHY